MRPFATFLLITFSYAFAQDKLVNTYSFYSEVYGGMEDGGIQRTDSYIFVAHCPLTIKEIYFEGKEIQLQKGDTLQVSLNYFTPYIRQHQMIDTLSTIKIPPPEYPGEKFKVYKQNRIYYANLQYPHSWSKEIVYVTKKRTLVAKAKEGFDAGNTGYAP